MPFVYLHKYEDGRIYYVGKAASEDRAYSKHGRNKEWLRINKTNRLIVELIQVDTLELATELEQLILDDCKTLINKKKISDERLNYSDVDWKSIVKYDEDSPTFLTYLVDNSCRNPKFKKLAGQPAGYIRTVKDKPCATKIEHKGHSYNVHRIIWLLFNGDLDKNLVINHIDCNPQNNKISNLELISTKENNLKKKVHVFNITNTLSKIPYIQFCKRKNKDKIRVAIKINDILYQKQFCADTLGFDLALSNAKEYLEHLLKRA